MRSPSPSQIRDDRYKKQQPKPETESPGQHSTRIEVSPVSLGLERVVSSPPNPCVSFHSLAPLVGCHIPCSLVCPACFCITYSHVYVRLWPKPELEAKPTDKPMITHLHKPNMYDSCSKHRQHKTRS